LPTTDPTTEPTAEPTLPPDCFNDSTKFDFYEAGEPVINNLGGFGPQDDIDAAPVIRWNNFGTLDSLQNTPGTVQGTFDLVVEVISDNYTPKTPGQNGLNGNFGQVNVKSGTDVTLKFSFVDHETGKPVVIPKFEWTFFDLDHTINDDGSPKAQETVRVCDFSGDFLGAIRTDQHSFTEWMDSEGCSNFQSGEFGDGCDNPLTEIDLGEVTCGDRTTNQLNKAVALSFKQKSSFEITLKTGEGGGGRNFFFAGKSLLAYQDPCLDPVIPPCTCVHEATLEQLELALKVLQR